MPRFAVWYDETRDFESRLNANKVEEIWECGMEGVGSGYVPVSGFCENGNEFLVFHKTPPEEAS
jgi:hypothetical protein